MRKKYDELDFLLSDCDTVFVFPSEIAAREWAVYVLFRSDPAAIETERFISWDKFKERTFQLYRSEKPVNRELRSLFAAHLLELNRKDNFLDFLIPAEYSEYGQQFRSTVESILMSINSGDKLENPAMDSGFRQKLSRVFRLYSAFLKKHGLFEPGSISPVLDSGGCKYKIMFPETISDYREYASLLGGDPAISLFSLKDEPEEPLVEFASATQEIGWIAERLERELAANPEGSIAISCAGNEDMFSSLAAELNLRNIPWTRRGGQVLGKSAGTAVFRHIRTLSGGVLSHTALSAAVFDNSLPWKNRDDLKKMIAFLSDKNFVRNNGPGKADVLDRLLGTSGNAMYSGWYRKLRRCLEAVKKSGSFEELYSAVEAFVFGFLDLSEYGNRVLAEYQLAMKNLAGMKAWTEQIKELELPDLYEIFMDHLDKSIYVPRQSGAGVQLYPYRVAAGIPADLHLVCGCSRAAVRVRQTPFPFLNENQRFLLGLEDTDYSDDFIRVYAGTAAVCTYSRQGYGGSNLPPGIFIRNDMVSKAEESISRADAEKALWKNEEPGETRFSTRFADSMEAVLPLLTENAKAADRGKVKISGGMLGELLENISRDGQLKFSSTSLHAFYACPFSFLFERLLGLKECRYDARFTDPLLIGTVLHKSVELFFAGLKKTGKTMTQSSDDELKTLLEESYSQASRRTPAPWFEPAWEADRSSMQTDLQAWLEQERTVFPDAGAGESESVYSFSDQEHKLICEGKIDRIFTSGNSTFIVDYKKGKPDSNAGIAAADMLKGSKQIPFYVLLLDKSGKKADGAWYYSFREKKYQQVFVSKTLDAQQMSELAAWLEAKIQEAARTLREGVFQATEGGCGYCTFRSLCRVKFTLG